MCAVLVVVANILREATFQVAFVNCNDVIQEITPATPYPTLCDSILPRTFERSADRIHPQGSNSCGDFQSILGITIKDDELRGGSKYNRSNEANLGLKHGGKPTCPRVWS